MTVPPTSDERALASVLADRDDAELAALLDARGVSATVAWRDLFDMAAALLDPASIVRGLSALPRGPAVALADAAATASAVPDAVRAELVAAALVDAEGRPYTAVATAVADREAPAAERTAPRTTTAADDAEAAERAYTSAASLADLLLHALAHPLTRIGSGALGAADRRVLVDEGSVADADTADLLVDLAVTVGLLRPDDRSYLVTPDGRDWVSSSTVERWAMAAHRLREAMPEGLRTPEGGWIPAAQWDQAYPYDTAWPARASLWRAFAVAWGLLSLAGGEPAWSATLARGAEPDRESLRAYLPTEVDRVYLQNDLTAIAPGPLAPHLDVRLRSMARRESRAQASSYRFSADSLTAAITGGESPESVHEFLRTISLTGIPQPLEYLLSRSADRRGTLRVGRDAEGRTRVTSDDPAALQTVGVDQALRALGLVSYDDALSSRVAPETVFWALADAKYPVVAVDDDGEARPVDRTRIADEAAPPTPQERYGELVTRLRAGSDADDADAAWLERELDQAVRTRAIVDVVVRLPDGSDRTFRLEATGLGGGRLRGRDRGADVERTLPLSSIASVHPVA